MKYKIGIIGLGYVGLPLAVEFGKKYKTVGYDIDEKRISELKKFNDKTLEVTGRKIKSAIHLHFTSDQEKLKDCNIYIITVPTPIDCFNSPNITPLRKASETVGKLIKKGDIVIYESTVYPGATEEVCVPAIKKRTVLKYNLDFFCGYSPERINPGDKKHRVSNIKKK